MLGCHIQGSKNCVRKALSPVLAILLVAGIAGCDERDEMWDESLTVEGPLVADEHLVWLDRTTSRLVLVDTSEEQASSRSVSLAPRPREVALAGSTALVTAGSGSEPVLDVVTLSDEPVVTSLDLDGEAYDRVFVSPGGDFAVLTHSMEGGASGGLAARNLNRVSIVDLTGSEPAQTGLLLETDSLAPREVVFSEDGSLAAVVLDSAIALVDLDDPSSHVRVPLRLPGGQRLLPRQVLFSPEADYLYVRADGTADLLVLELLRHGGLSATVNFLFVPQATALEAIHVPTCEGLEQHIVALFRSTQGAVAALLHASGDTSLGAVSTFSRRASRLTDLGDGLMLVHGAQTGSAFSRWIAAWEPTSGRVEEREVQGTYQSDPLVSSGRAFFRHESVTVADMGEMPAVTAVHVDPNEARLRVKSSAVMLLGPSTADVVDEGSYFAAVTIDRKDSGAPEGDHVATRRTTGALVAIEEGSLAIDGLVLDEMVEELGVVGDYVYAVHDSLLGDVTLIPRDELVRDAAVRYDGLLLGGLLDGGLER